MGCQGGLVVFAARRRYSESHQASESLVRIALLGVILIWFGGRITSPRVRFETAAKELLSIRLGGRVISSPFLFFYWPLLVFLFSFCLFSLRFGRFSTNRSSFIAIIHHVKFTESKIKYPFNLPTNKTSQISA